MFCGNDGEDPLLAENLIFNSVSAEVRAGFEWRLILQTPL